MAGSAVVGTLRAILALDSAEFESGIRKTSSDLNKWSVDATKMGQQATNLGSQLTKTLTLPIVALGAGAAKMAIDFDSAFAGVRKTVDATEPEFDAMALAFRNLAKQIPLSVNELARLGEAAGALGIPKQEIVEFSRVMGLLGVTTNLTADQAADAVARIQNIFGAAGKDTERLASTLVALGNAGASTETEIVEMGQRIAGAGHTIGLTQAQVLSFASTLASVGINAEAGGSAISRIFLKMNDAVMSGGSALAEFARVAGVSSAEFKKAFETDASQATVMFINGLGRLKAEGENTNQTMEGMIGKNIILKDTLNRLTGSGDLLSKQLAIGNQAWKDNNALSEEAKERFKTVESQLTLLWNRLKDVGITIGNALLPIIRDLVSGMGDLIPYLESAAKWFGGLPKPVQLFAVGLLGVGATLGPLLVVFGQMALAASQLGLAFTAGGIGATALGTALKLLPGVIAVLGTAWVAVKIGAWIGEITGLTDAIQHLTEKVMGYRDASIPQQQKAMALASKLAGHEIATYAEAMAFLEQRAAGLRAEHDKGKKAEAEATEAAKKSAAARAHQTQITEEAAKAQKAYNAELDALAKKFTGADLVDDVKKLADGVMRAGGASKLTKVQFDELGKELLDLERKGAKLPPVLAWIAYSARQAEFDARVLTSAVIEGGIEAAIARPKWKTLGEAWIDQHVKVTDLASAFDGLGYSVKGLAPPPVDPWQKWHDAAKAFVDGVSDSVARGVTDLIGHWSSHARIFGEIWQGIKNSFLNVLDDMLDSFLNHFLKGMIEGLGAAKFGQKLAGSLLSLFGLGGGGGGGIGGGIGGIITAGAGVGLGAPPAVAGAGAGAVTGGGLLSGLGAIGGFAAGAIAPYIIGSLINPGPKYTPYLSPAQVIEAFAEYGLQPPEDLYHVTQDMVPWWMGTPEGSGAEPEYSSLPGFAKGTGGKYVDFGAGTLAMLHGPEMIVPKGEGMDGSALNGQTMTFILERDGRKEAEFLVPFIPDVVRRYRLA